MEVCRGLKEGLKGLLECAGAYRASGAMSRNFMICGGCLPAYSVSVPQRHPGASRQGQQPPKAAQRRLGQRAGASSVSGGRDGAGAAKKARGPPAGRVAAGALGVLEEQNENVRQRCGGLWGAVGLSVDRIHLPLPGGHAAGRHHGKPLGGATACDGIQMPRPSVCVHAACWSLDCSLTIM